MQNTQQRWSSKVPIQRSPLPPPSPLHLTLVLVTGGPGASAMQHFLKDWSPSSVFSPLRPHLPGSANSGQDSCGRAGWPPDPGDGEKLTNLRDVEMERGNGRSNKLLQSWDNCHLAAVQQETGAPCVLQETQRGVVGPTRA